MSKVYIAADHDGFALKQALIPYIGTLGYEVGDVGAKTLDPADDYPDCITPTAHSVAADATARGVIIGKSGQGEAMAANRVPGVRAAVFYGGAGDLILLARAHNDANVLSLGADFLSTDEAKKAVKLFLETPFSGEERHIRRLAKF